MTEAVFGSGAIGPGGSARTVDMVGAFGLGSDVNVLDVSSRLGGTARAIALDYNAWVTGYESDPELAAAAMAPERVDVTLNSANSGRSSKSSKIKLTDKARIHHADIETLEIKPGVYHCAFTREMLHNLRERHGFWRKFSLASSPIAPCC
jgi:hypothetical protein